MDVVVDQVKKHLAKSNAKGTVVIGGSALTKLATPTSDIDLMVVGSKEMANLAMRHIGNSRPVDLEVRSYEWFQEFERRLDSFVVRATGGPSPFDFFDLRFAARLVLGKKVFGAPPEQLVEQIRIALADYFSTWWGATYQDVIGLYLGSRYDEALVLAGELAQRACMVALLQLHLVDPAPKWALKRCSDNKFLMGAAIRIQYALQCKKADKLWLEELLYSTNNIVATSRCVSITSDNSSEPPGPEICVLGRPGMNLLLDTSSGKILIHNDALLQSYSA